MTFTQFMIMAVLALLVTPVAVLFIPRARRSVIFDRLLWGATLLVAFLGAWLALGYANADTTGSGLSSFRIADVPVIASLIGAVAGALILNLPLVVLDLFSGAPDEEEFFGVENTADVARPPSANGNEQPQPEAEDVNRGS